MLKRAIRLAAVLIVAWAGAFGIAFAVIEWRGDEDGQTSQSNGNSTERNLTATEAEALAQKFLGTTEDERIAMLAGCEADDFNARRNEWIVACSATVESTRCPTSGRLRFGLTCEVAETVTSRTLHFVVGVDDDSRKARLLSP